MTLPPYEPGHRFMSWPDYAKPIADAALERARLAQQPDAPLSDDNAHTGGDDV